MYSSILLLNNKLGIYSVQLLFLFFMQDYIIKKARGMSKRKLLLHKIKREGKKEREKI